MKIQMQFGGRYCGKSITQNRIAKGGRGSNKMPIIVFDEMTEQNFKEQYQQIFKPDPVEYDENYKVIK